ncbi:hypothetical protein [Epilithonimonas hungarica]|nr:hypothetical protein [Epilithonimonas hungarica]
MDDLIEIVGKFYKDLLSYTVAGILDGDGVLKNLDEGQDLIIKCYY